MHPTLISSTILDGQLAIRPDDARMLLHLYARRLPEFNFISPLSHRLEEVVGIDEFWWAGARADDAFILETVALYVLGVANILQEWDDDAQSTLLLTDGFVEYGRMQRGGVRCCK